MFLFSFFFAISLASAIPSSFDWRQKGVIGPVQNQGQLGDVFDIVARECIQSLHAIQSEQMLDLSISQLSDCCDQLSGDPFSCVANKTSGLCLTSSYPKPLGKCLKDCQIAAIVKGGHQIQNGNESALLLALLDAPIFVAIDASLVSFESYTSGVYADSNCSPTQIDHALQLVGYGTDEKGVDFWICRNSWGPEWGEKGYIRIKRGVNMCGIAEYAIQPY